MNGRQKINLDLRQLPLYRGAGAERPCPFQSTKAHSIQEAQRPIQRPQDCAQCPPIPGNECNHVQEDRPNCNAIGPLPLAATAPEVFDLGDQLQKITAIEVKGQESSGNVGQVCAFR